MTHEEREGIKAELKSLKDRMTKLEAAFEAYKAAKAPAKAEKAK